MITNQIDQMPTIHNVTHTLCSSSLKFWFMTHTIWIDLTKSNYSKAFLIRFHHSYEYTNSIGDAAHQTFFEWKIFLIKNEFWLFNSIFFSRKRSHNLLSTWNALGWKASKFDVLLDSVTCKRLNTWTSIWAVSNFLLIFIYLPFERQAPSEKLLQTVESPIWFAWCPEDSPVKKRLSRESY